MISKNYLSLLLLELFLVSFPVMSQESLDKNSQVDQKQQNLDLEQTNYNQSSLIESEKQNNLNSNSQISDQKSMTLSNYLTNQDNIVSQLQNQFQTLTLQVETLQSYSQNLTETNETLNSMLLNCNQRIQDLENNLHQFKQALISNKEDTEIIIEQIGELQALLDYYKEQITIITKRLHRSTIMNELQLPVAFASGIITGIGIWKWSEGEDYGKYLTFAGIGCFAGFEIVFNVGHFMIKVW